MPIMISPRRKKPLRPPKKPKTNNRPMPPVALPLDLQHYALNNGTINYLDESSNTFLRLKDVNHEGNGDFAKDIFTLHTTDRCACLPRF